MSCEEFGNHVSFVLMMKQEFCHGTVGVVKLECSVKEGKGRRVFRQGDRDE